MERSFLQRMQRYICEDCLWKQEKFFFFFSYKNAFYVSSHFLNKKIRKKYRKIFFTIWQKKARTIVVNVLLYTVLLSCSSRIWKQLVMGVFEDLVYRIRGYFRCNNMCLLRCRRSLPVYRKHKSLATVHTIVLVLFLSNNNNVIKMYNYSKSNRFFEKLKIFNRDLKKNFFLLKLSFNIACK